MFRVGLGSDLHRLVQGRPLRLGGIDVESRYGPVSHSDGDVLLHAVADALLGALGEGDLGQHFPDDDPAWAGADSRAIVRKVTSLARRRGWQVVNLDAVIHAERPRLAPYREAMRLSLAECLGVEREQVNVKATTGEGVDAVGRGLALSCQAVVLLGRAE